MATEPVLISNVGSVEAPNSYTLPPGFDLEPTAITALFDGSGAAGDFLAVLTFYSQSGEILGRTFPSETVTAGDAVRVTYSPFAVPSSGDSPTDATIRPWIRRSLRAGAALSIASGVGSTYINYGALYGSDDIFTYFATSGTDGIKLLQAGAYLVTAEFRWTNSPLGIDFWAGIQALPANAGHNWTFKDPAVGSEYLKIAHSFTFEHRWPINQVLSLYLHQESGSAVSLDAAYLDVTYLGGFTGDAISGMDPAW